MPETRTGPGRHSCAPDVRPLAEGAAVGLSLRLVVAYPERSKMVKAVSGSNLRQQLIRTFENPNYRPPPLPTIALELQALTSHEDAGIEDVVRLLEKDEMLAGSVIRLVASPLYAGRGPVRSLGDAVIRLGVRTVRDVVFESALRRGVFDLPEFRETIEQIGRHSRATAHIARAVCRHARINDDMAFLCGLLHDIGFAALLFSAARGKPGPPLAEMWGDIDALHEQGSKLVTKLWGLPPELSTIVGAHHHVHTGSTSRMAAAITVSDYLTGHFGLSIGGPPDADGNLLAADAVVEVDLSDSRSLLGLDDNALTRILSEVEPLITQITSEVSVMPATTSLNPTFEASRRPRA
jgi:HD-like signal output (HDOD) protein